jgi:hypothetical protein
VLTYRGRLDVRLHRWIVQIEVTSDARFERASERLVRRGEVAAVERVGSGEGGVRTRRVTTELR